MYVTPERFRTMGLGVDTDMDDVLLRSTLYRAGTTIHSYCSVSIMPQQHDFRGGTVVGERHEWKNDPFTVSPTPFRFWPWHKPIRTITSLKIFSTPDIYTLIDPSEVFINNSAGYIEVSSLKLTQYGVFGAGVINALVGLWNPVVVLDYTYGDVFTAVGENLEPTDASYFRAQNQWWDSTISPEVKVNGTVVTVGFTIDYDEGAVIFGAAQAADALVTASYTYKCPPQIAQAEAYIAADDLGLSALRAKGMAGIDQLTVGEITIRRTSRLRGAVVPALSAEVELLLAPFAQVTIR